MNQKARNRLVVFAIYVGLIGLGAWIGILWGRLDLAQMANLDPAMAAQILMVGLLVFVLTSAIPFVPGAEIGLGLMVIFGGKVAPFVYAAMVAALTLAYLIGVLVPPQLLLRFFGYIGFQRTRDLVAELASRGRRERVDYLLASAPPKWVPFFLRHRYLAMMILFNVPGNSLVGGGGGLALAAGMSGLFRFPRFLAAVMVSVAPVPLFFLLTM